MQVSAIAVIETQMILISQITESVDIRSVKEFGVKKIQDKISAMGFLANFPLVVTPHKQGFMVVDGRHRLEAAQRCGLVEVPCQIEYGLSELELLRRAIQCNEASETLVPTTFIDQAELVWKLEKEGKTQAQIGEVLGWSRGKVSQYVLLQQICPEAWNIIATSFLQACSNEKESTVAEVATSVAFTEGLLRDILPLTPEQQLEIVTGLASNKINKKQFKTLAEAYRARNEVNSHVVNALVDIDSAFVAARITDINKGHYDKEWIDNNRQPDKKITRLIEAIREEWDQKHGVKLIHGDFNSEILAVADSSIDLVLTDPPYGISGLATVTKKAGKIVNADFDGEDTWDTVDPEQFQEQLNNWVGQFARVLRPGGALICFTDKAMISHLWEICKSHNLAPKSIISWIKLNPSPAGLARRNLISATEFMVWAVKPGSDYTFNQCSNWDRTNVLKTGLCAGDERIKDNQGNTLHPTQKPIALLQPLIELASNRGDTILDGFAGTGSTGHAAKQLGRKFIAIEQNEVFFEAMRKRLA